MPEKKNKKNSKKSKKGIDKRKSICYNIACSARWCGSMAEQLICNQQVDGSTPFTSSSIYGGIPERPKGADCKSVVTDFAGPNPASPTITRNRPLWSVFCYAAEARLPPRHLPWQVRWFAYPDRRSVSLLTRRREWVSSWKTNIRLRLVVGFLLYFTSARLTR